MCIKISLLREPAASSVENQMQAAALRHVRHVDCQVGGFALMATSDLKKVAPLWLNYTIAVRYDPDVRPSCFFTCTPVQRHVHLYTCMQGSRAVPPGQAHSCKVSSIRFSEVPLRTVCLRHTAVGKRDSGHETGVC